ncbi:hypothetical protein NQ317_009673, partial [Molorchus minor]
VYTWISWVIWNLGDTFIILLSLIMATRFQQISNTLKIYLEEINTSNSKFKIATVSNYKGFSCHSYVCGKVFLIKKNSTYFRSWKNHFFGQIREDYNKMANICNIWNDLFANLVIISYASNLSFILIQLFNSLRHMETVIERVYFFYSFGMVIMRTVVVSICAASVNQESKRFLPLLNSAPSDVYCVEIKRLITQIYFDSSALTGHNFFRITRGLVLNVAAAIITYELVLIQFNQATFEKFMSSNEKICY